jgi:hypothetical protein
LRDYGIYEGPRHGKGDANHVSLDWCGGVVVGSSRFPHYPMATEYSRAVARRIAATPYAKPVQKLVDILEWRRTA